VSGAELASLLEIFGYVVTRQKGSHLRLTTQVGGEHHVTVPNHARPRSIETDDAANVFALNFPLTRTQSERMSIGT
jgi:predicted RNA binding protein YcfA (HicA-like mRNA interferase family)